MNMKEPTRRHSETGAGENWTPKWGYFCILLGTLVMVVLVVWVVTRDTEHKVASKQAVSHKRRVEKPRETLRERRELEEKRRQSKRGSSEQLSEYCYNLGYRYGRCATLVLFGLRCPPEDDFIMPAKCRGLKSTKRGLRAGVRSVYEEYNIPVE